MFEAYRRQVPYTPITPRSVVNNNAPNANVMNIANSIFGSIFALDTSDLIICAILYLLYLENEDTDFLIMLAVFAFGMTGR